MAKIGIITYHFAGNYGAVLQCYALSNYLRTIGHTAYVLNCVSPKQADNNSLYRKLSNPKGAIKNLCLLPFHTSRKQRFQRYDEFRNNQLNMTRLVTNNDELKTLIEELNLDYVISGSDQVFNPNIYDFESMFFLPFEIKAKKIGYAVSVGKATKQQLSTYKNWIADFSIISAREQSAADRLTLIDFYGKKSPVVVDPVFLLNKENWESICVKNEKKYVLGYFINQKYAKEYIRISKKVAKELGLEFVIVSARITKDIINNKVITNAGPKEFCELFMNASFICTDSFHGTSFSILFEKEFVCYEPQKNSLDTRKTNLCRVAGIEKNIYYLDAPSDTYKQPTDYTEVKIKMQEPINASKEFLKTALK